MRPLRDLVRHTLIYGFGSVGVSLISFLLIPVYTRYLTAAEYGILALFLLVQAVLSRFYDLGLTNAVARFYFDYREGDSIAGLGELISTTTLFLFVHAAVLSGLLALAAPSVAAVLVGDPTLAPLARIVAITLFLEALSIPALTLIRMQERSAFWVGLSVLRVSGTLALNIYFLVFAGMGVNGILLSNALAATAVFVITLVPLLRRIPLVFRWDVLRRMLAFGLPFLPVLLGVLVIDLSDRYLLQWLRTTEEVGVYSVGYKFGQIAMVAVSAFSMGWAPLRYRIFDRPDARQLYARILTFFTSVASLGVVAVSVFGSEIVRLATTPPFFAGARVIPLVCGSYALYGIHIVVATGMGVTKRTLGLSVGVVLAAASNLGANLVLIPRYGMMGAAVATFMAYALMVVATSWFSQRVYPVPYEWGRILRIALVAALVVAFDVQWQPSDALPGLALGGFLLLVYGGLLYMCGGFRRSDIGAFRRWFGELRQERGPG